jgi:hypothetical protein
VRRIELGTGRRVGRCRVSSGPLAIAASEQEEKYTRSTSRVRISLYCHSYYSYIARLDVISVGEGKVFMGSNPSPKQGKEEWIEEMGSNE